MEYFSDGAGHKIYRKDDLIIKTPKLRGNFQEMDAIVKIAQQIFGNFILNTIVEENPKKGYTLKQPFIRGSHINQDNIDSVFEIFEELLKIHKKSFSDNGVGLDFVGLEGAIKGTLFQLKKYKGTKIDKFIITPILKNMSKRDDIFGRIFDFWQEGSIPELANIMIDENGQLKIIDLSLTQKNGTIQTIRAHVIEEWNKYFLKKFFGIIY